MSVALATSTFLNVVSLAELERPPKRPRNETDKTEFLCENLIQPFDTLPTHAGQLVDLINTPLLAKLPVVNYSDLGKFAQLGDSIYFDEIDRESELALVIKNALSETRFTQIKTEIELAGAVDRLTTFPLGLLCSNSDFQIEFSRNAKEKRYTTKSKSTPATIKNTRPDLLGYVKDVLICINIVRILKTMITKNAFPAKVIPLDHVEKVVPESELYGLEKDCKRVDTLKDMYELAKGHHGLVQIFKAPSFKANRKGPGRYTVKLKTRGLERSPENEETTRVMTRSLLTGLKTLHEKDFVHRDIRSSNIIYDSNNSQGYEYVLIDFEHGGKINEKFDSLLTDWDDGTCDENNTYTTLSDMYQLGKLLERLNTVSSDDGKDFISKLKKKMLGADAALQHPWIVSI
ncbi:hypothetical protein G9A89_009256 [Geosiphon pyriformis]|nr:hypothetical protein G9A89_009256 [Geosiphon pyriformis]